jgi:hypothetical protein
MHCGVVGARARQREQGTCCEVEGAWQQVVGGGRCNVVSGTGVVRRCVVCCTTEQVQAAAQGSLRRHRIARKSSKASACLIHQPPVHAVAK